MVGEGVRGAARDSSGRGPHAGAAKGCPAGDEGTGMHLNGKLAPFEGAARADGEAGAVRLHACAPGSINRGYQSAARLSAEKAALKLEEARELAPRRAGVVAVSPPDAAVDTRPGPKRIITCVAPLCLRKTNTNALQDAFVAGCADHSAYVGVDGRVVSQLRGHAGAVTGVVPLDGTGEEVLTASDDGTCLVFELQSASPVCALVGHTAGISSVAHDHVLQLVATASTKDKSIRLFDVSLGNGATMRGSCVWMTTSSTAIVCCAVSHEAGLWAGQFTPEIRVWAVSRIRHNAESAHADVGVTVVTHRPLETPHRKAVQALAFGRGFAVSGGDDARVVVWDTPTMQVRHVLVGHTSFVRSLAVSNSTDVVSADEFGVAVWDVVGGVAKARKMWLGEAVRGGASVSGDGSVVLVGVGSRVMAFDVAVVERGALVALVWVSSKAARRGAGSSTATATATTRRRLPVLPIDVVRRMGVLLF